MEMYEPPLRAYLMKLGEKGLLLRWKKRSLTLPHSHSFSLLISLPPSFSLPRWFVQVDEMHSICYYQSHLDLSSPLGTIHIPSAHTVMTSLSSLLSLLSSLSFSSLFFLLSLLLSFPSHLVHYQYFPPRVYVIGRQIVSVGDQKPFLFDICLPDRTYHLSSDSKVPSLHFFSFCFGFSKSSSLPLLPFLHLFFPFLQMLFLPQEERERWVSRLKQLSTLSLSSLLFSSLLFSSLSLSLSRVALPVMVSVVFLCC
jgi:hypothetical protein